MDLQILPMWWSISRCINKDGMSLYLDSWSRSQDGINSLSAFNWFMARSSLFRAPNALIFSSSKSSPVKVAKVFMSIFSTTKLPMDRKYRDLSLTV